MWLVLIGFGVWAWRTASTAPAAGALGGPSRKAAGGGGEGPPRRKARARRPSRSGDERSAGVSKGLLRNGLVFVDVNNVRGCAGPRSCDAAAFCGALCRWAKRLDLDQRVVVVVDHGDAPLLKLCAGLVVQFAGTAETADDAIVRGVQVAAAAGLAPIIVVTSDNGLKSRCKAAHAHSAKIHAPPVKLVPSRAACDNWLLGGGASSTSPVDDEWVVVDRGALYDHSEDPDPGWHPFHPSRDAARSSPTKGDIKKRKKHTTLTTRETTSSRVAQATALYAQVAEWTDDADVDSTLRRFFDAHPATAAPEGGSAAKSAAAASGSS